MVDIKKILANSSPEAIQKIKEIVNEKDDNKLSEYVKELIKPIEDTEKKVESSVRCKEGNEVIAFFNIADYDWIRYKGKYHKTLPCSNTDGSIIRLQPETVLGISKVADLMGNYKVLLPDYMKFPVSLGKNDIVAIKSRSNPYTGNVALLFVKSK